MKFVWMNGWKEAPHAVIRNWWRFSYERAPGAWRSFGFFGFVLFVLE